MSTTKVEKGLCKEMGKEEFEYGNHIITVTVTVFDGKVNYRLFMNDTPQNSAALPSTPCKGWYREVTVTATEKGSEEPELENSTRVLLEPAESNSFKYRDYIRSYFSEKSVVEIAQEHLATPSIEEQVEAATTPVFNKLDELYRQTDVRYKFDLDVSVERMKCKTSIVDPVDELEKLVETAETTTETRS